MNKETLNQKLLHWLPEIVFAEKQNVQLTVEVDAFNNHLYWNVYWEQDGLPYYEEFYSDEQSAFDFFLLKVEELK